MAARPAPAVAMGAPGLVEEGTAVTLTVPTGVLVVVGAGAAVGAVLLW